MALISYAQNFEDVMLWRALKHIPNGFYIDVGANDPNQDSITKAFYERGWRGINIEPVSQWFEKLVKERPRDINLQLAAGYNAGTLILYEIPDTGLSTLDKATAERHESKRGCKKIEREVPIRTLTEICLNYHVAPIHFLNVDVEGAEKEVLQGLDFSKIRPWIILLESTLPDTQIENYSSWEPILFDADYHFVYFDGINRFYVAKEHHKIKNSFNAPPNYFDDFTLAETQSFCQYVASQAKQAQVALTEQQAHSQWLQNEWNAAQARIVEYAGELETAKSSTEHLTAQLGEKIEALAEEHAHSRWLQQEWESAKAQSERSISELAATRTHAEHLTGQILERNETLESTQLALTRQQALADTLQNELSLAKTRLEGLTGKLAVLRYANKIKAEQLKEKKEALVRSQANHESQRAIIEEQGKETQALKVQLSQLQAHDQWLKNEWDAAEAKIADLKISHQHWHTAANDLGIQMQSVLNSKSWRITEPLRRLMIRVRAIPWLCKFSGLDVGRNPLGQVNAPIAASIEGLPAATQTFIEPHEQESSVAASGTAVSPQPTAVGSEAALSGPDLSGLTPWARRIYVELKTAIGQRR